MGTEFADYNGDGRLDLVVTNHEFETHSLFRNDGKGSFSDATVEAGIASPTLPFVGFGVAFFDADNNGDLDLSIVNGHVIDNTAVFRAGLDARAAEAAVPATLERAAPLCGGEPSGGPRLRRADASAAR